MVNFPTKFAKLPDEPEMHDPMEIDPFEISDPFGVKWHFPGATVSMDFAPQRFCELTT